MVVKNAAQDINSKSLLEGTCQRPRRTNAHDIRDVLTFCVAHCKVDICMLKSGNVTRESAVKANVTGKMPRGAPRS